MSKKGPELSPGDRVGSQNMSEMERVEAERNRNTLDTAKSVLQGFLYTAESNKDPKIAQAIQTLDEVKQRYESFLKKSE